LAKAAQSPNSLNSQPLPQFMLIDKSKDPIFATLDGIWKLYPNLHYDCSGFLKKVAQQLCVVMSTGDANAIVAYLQKTPGWLSRLATTPQRRRTSRPRVIS
jgi:hypothetical protein